MAPRSSWDRMTPEFPRAPISEPWAMALHTAAMSGPSDGRLAAGPEVGVVQVGQALELGQLGHHRLHGEGHVGPRVPVGDGIDVQPVDGVLVEAQDMAVGGQGPRHVGSA